MQIEHQPRGHWTLSFGGFELSPARRSLLRNGRPVALGGRAFDVLVALVERAGHVVSKDELIAKVWPDIMVDEGSVRLHVASIRKALGESADATYVTTVVKGGYCFVAPVARYEVQLEESSAGASSQAPHLLPSYPSHMVGRDKLLQDVSVLLKAQKLLTLVGPGGVGKTTLAVRVGYALLQEFGEQVLFCDLTSVVDPDFIPSIIAFELGLCQLNDLTDPTARLIGYFKDRTTLLILDGCEHVIERSALLAKELLEKVPQLHILATSREALSIYGENVRTVPPLDYPPSDLDLTVQQILSFSAAQLLIERMASSGYSPCVIDSDISFIGEICRGLDGMPLAIELAAGNVSAFGLKEIAARLSTKMPLLWRGKRTAASRHQTLAATLDWSYQLLRDSEQVLLRRLSIFAGKFSLDAVVSVRATADANREQIVRDLVGLAAKSLVTVDLTPTTTTYRLLDITRTFALTKLIESGNTGSVARAHAFYVLSQLERNGASTQTATQDRSDSNLGVHLGDVRAALEWSFRGRDNVALGMQLAAASSRLFLTMSLLPECSRWTKIAINMLDETTCGTRLEMELQVAYGISSMLAQGESKRAGQSLRRGLELAEEFDDHLCELRALGSLSLFLHRAGDLRTALAYAERAVRVAEQLADPIPLAEANASLGALLHLKGDVAAARFHLEVALIDFPNATSINTFKLGHSYRCRARITLAGVLWLEGAARQAHAFIRLAIEESEALGHPVTVCMVRVAAMNILLRDGDLKSVDLHLEQLLKQADKYSLAPYRAVARAVEGELLARRGQPDLGVAQLREAVSILRDLQYEWMMTPLLTAIAKGLCAAGDSKNAIETIDQAMRIAERNGDLFTMPEMLRFKGSVLMALPAPRVPEAEDYFSRALDLAARQGALAWQLRTATSLAQLQAEQGDRNSAKTTLSQVHDRFSDNFLNADMRAARRVLADLA
jgi:predicted ATPase/DNA-binding winged helix-turn-helix (wHTH) protein